MKTVSLLKKWRCWVLTLTLVVSRREDSPVFPSNMFPSGTRRPSIPVHFGTLIPQLLGAHRSPGQPRRCPFCLLLSCWVHVEWLQMPHQCLGTATNLGILCILIIIQYIIKTRKGKKDVFIAALYPLGISSIICSAVELKYPKCFGSGTEVSFRAIVSCSIKF